MKLAFPRTLAALACTIALSGCGGTPTIVEGPMYPLEFKRGPTLDIQVIRHETEIRMTNTSGRSFGPCMMWINGRFSYELKDGFAVGESKTLDLAKFTDQYGEIFKAGGFFATERAEKLALAELAIDGQVLGMVVISDQEP